MTMARNQTTTPGSSAYDTIVVGLGAMGSATLMQLAKRGQRVLGLDRWNPPHAWGSTHGETRITRCAIGEGEAYVPLVLRSHEIWRSLEAETGMALLDQCGALILAPGDSTATIHGKENFVRRTIAAAERFDIPHEVLDAAEAMRRFPQFRLQGNEVCYFEPVGGYVRPERCIEAQLTVARRHGAAVQGNTQVAGITRSGAGVCVQTTDGARFHAAEAVLAAGTWSAGLLGGAADGLLSPHMSIGRQVLHWFGVDAPGQYAPGRFPVFIWMHGNGPEDSMYGFPILPGSEGVKVAREQYTHVTADPDALDRSVSQAEQAAMSAEHLAGRLPGLQGAPLRSVVCPYTNTPDGDFLIARDPGNDRVLLVSACSGHGFKHSAGLGEAVAATVVDGGRALSVFGAGRLQAA